MVLHLDRPPLNESAIAVFSKKAFLSGTVLSAVFYGTSEIYVLRSSTNNPQGIHLTIFLQCTHLLWTWRNTTPYSYQLLAYVITTFALGMSSIISISIANQYTFIDYRNMPGGPLAFAIQDSSTPDGLVVSWSSVVGDWLTGGLLVR